MNKVEQAIAYLTGSGSCSQAIVMSFGPSQGLPLDTAIKVASAFGGGMARRGETCGVVSGALMILGMTHDATVSNPNNHVYALAQNFIKRFQERSGSIVCRELLGVDLNTREGRQEAVQQNLFATRCPRFVQNAAEILEEMLPV